MQKEEWKRERDLKGESESGRIS